MSTALTTDTTPRAWIGCMHCYNDGRLIGEWFDAAGADEVTLADVHGGAGRVRAGCEELWVTDHENIPARGEMSPYDASEWAQAILAVPEHARAALGAWVESGDYIIEGLGDIPSVSDFEERYAGCWDSFREYAENLAEDIGLLDGAPEEVARYFDWTAWTRDLAMDFTTARTDGGVYVFRNM